MTPKQAKSNIEAFFAKYPMVKRWGDASYKNAKRYKYVETRLGRTIPVRNAYTESRNYPVQGSAGEVMLAALIELDKEITASGLDIKLVNIIHDEIVLEVAEAAAEPAKALLERAMVNGMLRVFPEAHTTGLVEAHIADNWGDAK
jgi:DNA polymerase-1